MNWYVRSRDKLNTSYLHLQKTHEDQTRQGADLQWDAPRSRYNFKNLYFHYHKSYG